MAIQFTTSLSEDKVLNVHNKNVIRFNSDIAAVPFYALIRYQGLEFQILPDADNQFYYDFDNVRDLIKNNNFSDDINPDISTTEASLIYDDTINNFIDLEVLILIYFDEDTDDQIVVNYQFLNSVIQLEEYASQNAENDDRLRLMAPTMKLSINDHALNYWNGYPFDVGIVADTLEPFELTNATVMQSRTFTPLGRVNRLFFSDGETTAQIEDVIPLVNGVNRIEIENITLLLNKIDSCGHYFKFKNQKGAWSYWLFNPWVNRVRGSNQVESKNNNFSNINETRSTSISLGRISDDELNVIAENLSSNDVKVLSEILDSPKIYYFKGERFSRAEPSHWLEVELKDGNQDIEDYKVKNNEMALTFKMPKRYTMR